MLTATVRGLGMAVVLLLALAAATSAQVLDSTRIGISAEIDKFAQIRFSPDGEKDPDSPASLDFGELTGRWGIYTADQDWMYLHAKTLFGAPPEMAHIISPGIQDFWLESNTDVNVSAQFVPDEAGWLSSKTLFSIAKHGTTSTLHDFGPALGEDDPFVHSFANQDSYGRRYTVLGAIWIEEIADNMAGSYTGTIVLTVSTTVCEQAL